MLPANRHLLPVIGIDIHMIIILGAPVPVPHPFIGLVFDPMDWIPKVGATVSVNSIPRANSGTNGMLGTKAHIPLGGPFALAPTIGHESMNFFGSPRVTAEGSYFSGAGFMVMSCNDVGVPLSVTPGKKFKPIPSLYLPTSACIPIPGGKPVIVGGPYVPDLMGMLMGLVMSFGFGALMKIGGKLLKKALTALNHGVLKKFKCTKGLSKKFCKHGFEPVNLITGSVLYEGCDFEIPGPIPISWDRNWYSDSDYEGLLGHGAHLCYDQTFEIFEEDKMIGIILPDGRSAGFPLILSENESFYHRPEKLTLTCRERNIYDLFDHNSQLTYVFERLTDNVFKPVLISNISGLSIRLYYNGQHCLSRMTDTAGRNILLHLDDNNRIIKVEAKHRGSRRLYIEYGYNEAGDLCSITDANGKTTSIRYENHLMVQKTDRNGQTFYWKYDGLSTGARCIHTYGDGGLLEGRIEYGKGYNVVTNSLGEQTTYYYDETGLCIRETDPMGHDVFHEYTDFIELYRDIDQEGHITGYVYDERGNMTSIQKPDGSIIRYLYDETGNIKMVTDAEGNNTVYVYKSDRIRSVVKADGTVTTYEYYETGLIKNIKSNNGQVTALNFDDDHNLVKIHLPEGADALWQHDEWGRCIKFTNPLNQFQQFKYDPLDRVTGIRKYDGNKVALKYNAYDDVVLAEDIHHRVRFEYTPLGNFKLREENGNRIQYNYNTEERLVSLVNEYHELYRFNYDKRGMLITESGFDGLKRKYIRNNAGKVVKINRPGGKFTEYEYDLSGRIIRTEYSDGSWQIYNYNKNGQLTEAINESAIVKIQRDESGRVIKEVQDEHIVDSKYNDSGKRVKISSSLGADIDIFRNEAGGVQKMIAANKAGATWEAQFEYNALGMETERFLPGGVISTFEYDHSGHPAHHNIRVGKKVTRNRNYSWNVNERLQKMVNGITNAVVEYGHDEFGNLAWAKYEDSVFDYRLPDKVGNLYKTTGRTDRKYGAGGRLLESEGTRYEYDEEGNLVSKNGVDGSTWKYGWSGNGMMNKVIRPDGKEVTFEYDALGRRTAKIFNGNITRWVWDGSVPLHEYKYELNKRPKTYINEIGNVIIEGQKPPENEITWIFDVGCFKPAAKLQNNEVISIITDYLGTPVEMYNESGVQKWSAEYNIYGKIRKQIIGKQEDCPFRYQGQYEDEETGLYYNRFRYYFPIEGMYVAQQDPIRLNGGLSLYSYVKDPNFIIDIFGLASNYLFRGDDNHVPGDGMGMPLGSDADIMDPHAHVTRPGKGETSIYTSFSETEKGTTKFTKDGNTYKVSIEELKKLEAEGKIKIHTPEQVKEMVGGKKGKDAFSIMKANQEILIEGEIPASLIKKCK